MNLIEVFTVRLPEVNNFFLRPIVDWPVFVDRLTIEWPVLEEDTVELDIQGF